MSALCRRIASMIDS